MLCGLAVAAYNYARFGNPLEFGTRYLLGGDQYRNFHLSATVARGLYYLLICPPDLVPEFPFFRLALRPLPGSQTLDPGYFLEPIAGVLSICPLLLLAPVLGWKIWKRDRAVAWTLAAMFSPRPGRFWWSLRSHLRRIDMKSISPPIFYSSRVWPPRHDGKHCGAKCRAAY
jgi:hypothetical protein